MGRSGTGLGMAVVLGTVEDHNGEIDVQSREGEGSTFTLYFPSCREAVAETRLARDIEQDMGSGESVLIVDDIFRAARDRLPNAQEARILPQGCIKWRGGR